MSTVGPAFWTAASSGPPSSPFSVLLHFDAANGSTTYTDEAGNSWDSGTPPFDRAEISTAQFKFGGSSLDLSNDTIYTNPFVGPFGADVDLIGDFTIEGWVYMTSGADYVSLVEVFDGLNPDIGAAFNGSTLEFFLLANPFITITDGAGFVNQWVHWFVGRSGGTGYAGLNGLIVSGALSGTPSPTEQISIGDPGGAPAYVDEFRVTNGTCLYTGATYTVPTSAFPNP